MIRNVLLSKETRPIDTYNLKNVPNDKVAEIIKSNGDLQDHKTNLKCDMTSWRFHQEHPLIVKLTDAITEIVSEDTKPYKHILLDCWGAVYRKGDYATPHFHLPCSISFVYFVKTPKGSSPLVFDNTFVYDKKKKKYKDKPFCIYPKDGQLIIFSSDTTHSVSKSTIDEERIIISGNYFYLPEREFAFTPSLTEKWSASLNELKNARFGGKK